MIQCIFIGLVGLAGALQSLPPALWTENIVTTPGFFLNKTLKNVYIDSAFANVRDTEGLTLIPPTAYEFAETFCLDMSTLFGGNWTLKEVTGFPSGGIFLGPFRGDHGRLGYENGISTEEGYELDITKGAVYVGGTGARGMFWGTRTLIQRLLILNGTLSLGLTIDAPAYSTRGYMLDAGRKWYTADFLKELCTYASFFKISEFHYHSSDNYPLNRGRNETWSEVFSHFSLFPKEHRELQAIIQRPNETLSRDEFEDLQAHCAQRGITIIPEIESPGHALAITKWKPELALAKKDLLNLSHPDTIPTIKAIWAEFLPWFQTKEVHIGADEYDQDLADEYINFVNEMSDFINTISGKRIRIWGTHEPSESLVISKNIIVQHWQYGQSNPVKLQKNGYDLINSEDWWAYITLKNDHVPILPAPYPQFFNVTRTINFANVLGWQWEPSLYNPVNTSEQLQSGARGNKGAILAAWNDNGPDATTQLEAYYAMREGIPVVAARAWSGVRGVELDTKELKDSIGFLYSAPGQNLDRRIPHSQNPSQKFPLLSWNSSCIGRKSGTLNRGSYGPPYTLSIYASSPFTLSGSDTSLNLNPSTLNIANTKGHHLTFTTADNFSYPLRSTSITDGHEPGHPGRIWSNQSTSSHEHVLISLPAILRIETDVVNGSRVWINDDFVGRFEVFVFGGRNSLFSWSQMALVAPLEKVEGGVDVLVLESDVGRGTPKSGNCSYSG
ncbi:glycoside hydrolase superfamily [Pyrenochaeta sp. MPI-SDFR-AT-0127]|nr:glycoside hydrolase superfamily [Pyrenochaeta sp. MPI-SDFR-AT-0127]